MTAMRLMAAATLIVGSGLALHAMPASPPTEITRSDVVRGDLGVPGREVIQVRVDFAPGAAFGRHSHPGVEVAYVLHSNPEAYGPATLRLARISCSVLTSLPDVRSRRMSRAGTPDCCSSMRRVVDAS